MQWLKVCFTMQSVRGFMWHIEGHLNIFKGYPPVTIYLGLVKLVL